MVILKGETIMQKKDVKLTQALKQAGSNKMYFAFIPKGSEGKLIVSNSTIPSKLISQVKKEIGGGTPVIGKCFGPIEKLVFRVGEEPSATLTAAIKKVAHRDSGLNIAPHVRVDPGADAEEHEALLTRLQFAEFFGATAKPGVEEK
jgi:hypothetical protein